MQAAASKDRLNHNIQYLLGKTLEVSGRRHEYTDLFGKLGIALPANYKLALEGYLSVLETVRREI
jgi:hypothetical protein